MRKLPELFSSIKRTKLARKASEAAFGTLFLMVSILDYIVSANDIFHDLDIDLNKREHIPDMATLREVLKDAGIVEVEIETFSGDVAVFLVHPEDLTTPEAFNQTLGDNGVGYKTVKAFYVVTLDGKSIGFYRNRRGGRFKRQHYEAF